MIGYDEIWAVAGGPMDGADLGLRPEDSADLEYRSFGIDPSGLSRVAYRHAQITLGAAPNPLLANAAAFMCGFRAALLLARQEAERA